MRLQRVVVLAALGALAACAGGEPGSDTQGLAYRAAAAPVLQALAAFEQSHRALPGSLAELAPDYLDQLPAEPELMLDRKSRLLAFSYSPPLPRIGRMTCSARIGAADWSCQGHL